MGKVTVFDFSKKKPKQVPRSEPTKSAPKKSRESELQSQVDQLHRVQGKSPGEVITIMRALGTSERELAKIPRYLGQLRNKFTVATTTEIELSENIRLILLKKKLVLTEIQVDGLITELKPIIRKHIR